MDNAPCWCGSGKTFQECHIDRIQDFPLPPGKINDVLRKIYTKKVCLHPEASKEQCTKIIQAHTIQRRGAIERITSSDNHVLSFYPPEKDQHNKLKLHRVGWKKASTFRGFCSHHDNSLFSNLEDEGFIGTDKQCFLVGYRALCHALYQKITVKDSVPFLKSSLDKGRILYEQFFIQDLIATSNEGLSKGLEDLTPIKQEYDKAIMENSYNSIHQVVIDFKGTMAFTSTGVIHVEFDVNGKLLQDLLSAPVPAQTFSISIVSTEQGGVFIATWPRRFSKCKDFFRALFAIDKQNIPSILLEFIFAYVENTFFSETWWNSLTHFQRDHLNELAGLLVPYGKLQAWTGNRYLDWEITEINSTFSSNSENQST
ncbi:MAG TPA: hypothetical protein DD706_19360 [Nitrospiraceae bacterium]|nr:hypothetical protein [Nitrospiraceae bacterium]